MMSYTFFLCIFDSITDSKRPLFDLFWKDDRGSYNLQKSQRPNTQTKAQFLNHHNIRHSHLDITFLTINKGYATPVDLSSL